MRTFLAITLSLPLLGCRLVNNLVDAGSEPSLAASTRVAPKDRILAATITQGVIWTRAGGEEASRIEAEISSQLQYVVGQLDGLGAVADLTRLTIDPEIPAGEPGADGWQIAYQAQFQVAWPGGVALPGSVTLTLPRGGDASSRAVFYQAFVANCADDTAAADVYTTFWYHYRPDRKGCPLASGDLDRALAAHASLTLASPAAAPAKAPPAAAPRVSVVAPASPFIAELAPGGRPGAASK